ncbi:MAG: MBL fold metallo-hydrolase [Bacteroidales bacterium]|nr:MBL fold metallo-hydrolase [Bacteroidales bacterium]
MKITVLSDNIGSGDLKGEWGLSFHIEFNGRRYLLDTGGSGLFLDNASKLGIDISEVDCAVLSHAHYDHSLGMEAFLRCNAKADFFVSPNACENCYGGLGFLSKYIGLPKGVLSAYKERIKTPEGIAEIDKNVFVVPHSTPGLSKIGRKSHLYVRRGLRYMPDDFAHEQSLVFLDEDGLVIFNSCSHSGADVVMEEVGRAFPGQKIKAYLGGLHMFRMNESEVREMAARISGTGIRRVITGHCTGDKAFAVLKSCLGDIVDQFHCGMVIEL